MLSEFQQRESGYLDWKTAVVAAVVISICSYALPIKVSAGEIGQYVNGGQ